MFEPSSESCDSDGFDLDFGDTPQENQCKNVLNGNSKHNWNDTDIQMAIRRGEIGYLQRILDEGFPVDRILSGGWTSLMYACDNGNSGLVNLLLKNGADAKTQIDTFSALMAVCSSQCDSEEILALCANLLITDGAVVNAHDRHHMTPLMYACQHSRATLVQLLLTYDADINHQDVRGWTAFVYAANDGNEAIMKLLLQAGADPQIMTNSGETAAMMLDISRNGSYVPTDSCDLQYVSHHEYADLEVFLLGLQMEDILPLFKKHCVDLVVLFTMTEDDLKEIGISQIALRKKIVHAVANVHKKQWDMPEQKKFSENVLSSSEVVVTLSHLTKHIQYLQTTVDTLIFSCDRQLLDWRMESVKAQEFCCEMKNLEDNVDGLQQRIIHLRNEVMEPTAFCLGRQNKTKHFAAILGTCAIVCSGLIYLYRCLR